MTNPTAHHGISLDKAPTRPAYCACGDWSITYTEEQIGHAVDQACAHIEEATDRFPIIDPYTTAWAIHVTPGSR